jgi:exodeoxyribonuclease VII small subunit
MAKQTEKTAKSGKKEPKPGNFEARLERLEELGERIRRTDVPLDDALAAFEEGIRVAKTLERDLEKVESRIELLLNDVEAPKEEGPELELFDEDG